MFILNIEHTWEQYLQSMCFPQGAHTVFGAMNGENRLLVTDEPVEVQDFRKITDEILE